MARNLFDVVTVRRSAVARALPEDVSITFEVVGLGGGTWTLESEEGGEVRVYPDAPRRSDCRVQCSVDDFHSLLRGELDGRDGFMSGRLRVEGDVGLALRLQAALIRLDGDVSVP